MSATCYNEGQGYLCGVVNGDDKNDGKSRKLLEKNTDLIGLSKEASNALKNLKKNHIELKEKYTKLKIKNESLLKENDELKKSNTKYMYEFNAQYNNLEERYSDLEENYEDLLKVNKRLSEQIDKSDEEFIEATEKTSGQSKPSLSENVDYTEIDIDSMVDDLQEKKPVSRLASFGLLKSKPNPKKKYRVLNYRVPKL